ncbi:uncharacterized protein K460DRAFT_16081 [Cucurbitaria berberidis CBS 394.84]|uniref:Uncharacterized protein n=1 Tax=Cucurbitaria berberidis CBS 394.84 TaxID=1168544 RepID=A0A9P4GSG7_9PLEO|nr:uncharacterized protein K460DRAFT_16081 [Cucurbitaria berberidis CBS 394.84]KAF1850464.1 hypothetical protein K460DRAFT_16081 [Cucurbitaria berberidis CBS 394.84]
MFSNSFLLLLWTVSFVLFTWWSSGMLTHTCNKGNWRSSVGINICRLFKALFAFTCVGLVSTLLATHLDLRVYRDDTRSSKYEQIETKTLDVDQTHTAYGEDEVAAPRETYHSVPVVARDD